MFVLGTELQAQKSSSNSLQFNYEESKSHFYQMVQRPSFIFGPKLGLVLTENGYAGELGLVTMNATPGRTFGLSLSYVTGSTVSGEPSTTSLEFSGRQVLETTSFPEVERFGLRASILIPTSNAWLITIGGGADYLKEESRMVQKRYQYEGQVNNSDRELLEEVTLSVRRDFWEPVVSVGIETYFGNLLNMGVYASSLIEEDFYNNLHVGVYVTINFAGL